MAQASSGRWHQTSLPIFWPGFFMSRTSTAWRLSSRSAQRIRVISSWRRVEKMANAITLGMLIELGRRCCISKKCSRSLSSSAMVGRRSRSLLLLTRPSFFSTFRASGMANGSIS
ncbi:hypothetical protein D9M68_874010 [compost metagenome]